MRLHKLLFLIFLVLYFIAGLSLLITGSVAHRHAKQYAEVTGYSLMSGAGFIIALGVIILVLCLLGFYAAQANKLNFLTAFIITLGVIILLQLIAAIVAFTLRNKADDDLRNKLKNSLHQYGDGNSKIQNEWDSLQQEWTCCGADGPADWNNSTVFQKKPPTSCCPNNKCDDALSPTNYYKDGCYSAARRLFYHYSKALGGVAIFFFFVEIIGLVLAIVLLRLRMCKLNSEDRNKNKKQREMKDERWGFVDRNSCQ